MLIKRVLMWIYDKYLFDLLDKHAQKTYICGR